MRDVLIGVLVGAFPAFALGVWIGEKERASE